MIIKHKSNNLINKQQFKNIKYLKKNCERDKMKKIILASGSPRRKELAERMGIEFEIMPSTYKEDMTLNMPPEKLAEFLATGKAEEVASRVKEGVIIGIDTFIVNKETKEIYGKPAHYDAAKKTLKELSGKEINVMSGICIIDKYQNKKTVSHELTKVFMAYLSEKEIDAYVNTKEPLDKAGAFGIQELGSIFIKKIEGDYNNVVGFPVRKIYEQLTKLNINIFEYDKWKSE